MIKEGKVVTSDIEGNASTYEFTKEVIKNISSN